MPDEDRRRLGSKADLRNYLTFAKPPSPQVTIPLSEPPPLKHRDVLPAAMVLSSALLFALMQCLVRYITQTYKTHVIYISFYCGVVKTILTTLALLTHNKIRTDSTRTSLTSALLIIVRGIFGAIALITNYAALQRLPVGVTTCLSSMTPVLTSFLGWLCLGERLTWLNYVVLAIISVGATLVGISEPISMAGASNSQHVQGVLYCVLTALSIGCVYVIMRHLGGDAHVLWIVMSVSAGTMVTPVVIYWVQNGTMDSVRFFTEHSKGLPVSLHVALAGVGVFNFAASLLLNYGARLIAAGRSAVLMMVNIPLSFLVAFAFLHELPTSPVEISGCALIALSAYLTAVYKGSAS